MPNVNEIGKWDKFCIKIKAFLSAPFNSKKRKELRQALQHRLHEKLFYEKKAFYDRNPEYRKKFKFDDPFDATRIPVYIISYNHLSYLQQMINQLERYHLTNIHIIDNCSDYEPLLKYLKACPYTVHRMDRNYGHMVFWESGKFDEEMKSTFYVVTDPDIEFNKDLPDNFMDELYGILKEYPFFSKIGFALAIDDLPEGSEFIKGVKAWERRHWVYRIKGNIEMYDTQIDTTFALYKPGEVMKDDFYSAIRVAGPFTSRHLPWYQVAGKTEEDRQYINTSSNSSTISKYMKEMDEE